MGGGGDERLKAVEKTKKRKVKTMPGIQMALLIAFPSANFSPAKAIIWLLFSTFFLLLVAAGEVVSSRVVKYWRQRYSLFSRYDEGIAMDEEGWFSVTPEEVATRQAELCGRIGAAVVVDGFSGVGGNAIQFAKRGYYVVAMEIDPRKVEFGRHNAEIYGVEDSIDFIVGDFLRLAPTLKVCLWTELHRLFVDCFIAC
ncbi:hypothetical protein Taro_007186 [Colocasia esculenta]|uniref:Trimethylguanosine synthase n=1 Tax=Colocasia esculenta TaxID=4460 RepID=A0A843TTC3_COLES|nr:hypothetical protein [Colocasia esculenta]